ncbi:MAG: Smr/MutS family protein [Cytophagaceae bacterium]|jgi:DNA mismatch repair protein MutS2|nr:Smr/MutS family protein [Cytophagaceae bacterium]
MLYPSNIEAKLGFDQIRNLLNDKCESTLGQAYVARIRFSTDFELIQKLLKQTSEFIGLLNRAIQLSSQSTFDYSGLLVKIRPEASFLEPQELAQIKMSLSVASSYLSVFQQHGNDFPSLFQLTEDIAFDYSLLAELERIVDNDGVVRDTASPELGAIRKRLLWERNRMRKELDTIIRTSRAEGFSADDALPTIRNGRMVIPILAEYKRKIKGLIHDESNTGQTVFIEPESVFEMNNAIREYELEEKREIIRILMLVADTMRPAIPDLQRIIVFLGIVDFIRAKARLAQELEAIVPDFENRAMLDFIGAKHPLLYLSFKHSGRTVVPLQLKLEHDKRLLIISGPNAGGKSVALKTAGLLQYMLQCGLPVPVAEGTRMGVFRDILLDIGDEQSIENDLSTYSAHLSAMKAFLSTCGKKSLVLIDEFGSGTEPASGASIAEAVLEEFYQQKVMGVITTHFANIKIFADKHPGMLNGAMRFDLETLSPLYRLEIGAPGSSYALEIAGKIGLSPALLKRAEELLGDEQLQMERLLRQLEKEKNKLDHLIRENQNKDKVLQKEKEKFEKLRQELEKNRKQHLQAAKEEARQLLEDVNRRIETTIREIKEQQAEKNTTKNLRKDLEDFKEDLMKRLPEEEKVIPVQEEVEVLGGVIQIGDSVRIKDTGTLGEVEELNEKEAVLRIGALRSAIKLSRLEKVSRKEVKRISREKSQTNFSILSKANEFSPNLDVRGKRGEEALRLVDLMMDDAILLGVRSLKIVHGKGDGILRSLIRNHLKTYKQIISIADEHADRGGDGCTLINLE